MRFARRITAVPRRAARVSLDYVLDAVHGLDTTSGQLRKVGHNLNADEGVYQPLNYLWMKRVFAPLHLGPDDVVYEVGAGAGRVVCMLARLPVREVVGIEFNPVLAERARKNATRLRGRKAKIEIRTMDAALADYSKGTVYFFYGSFGTTTFAKVLDSIRATLVPGRTIRILLCETRPEDESLLESCEWLTRTSRYTPGFSRFVATYWASKPV